MEESVVFQIVCGAMGIFSIVGAFMNLSWFMNSRKAAFMIKILGPKGTRIFYVLLGSALLTYAIYGHFHPEVLPPQR